MTEDKICRLCPLWRNVKLLEHSPPPPSPSSFSPAIAAIWWANLSLTTIPNPNTSIFSLSSKYLNTFYILNLNLKTRINWVKVMLLTMLILLGCKEQLEFRFEICIKKHLIFSIFFCICEFQILWPNSREFREIAANI